MGYSYGGIIAFEMACRLHAQGERVAFLGLLDTLGPRARKLPAPRRLLVHLGVLRSRSPSEALDYARKAVQLYRKKLERLALKALGRAAPQRTHVLYVPSSVYPGSATLFAAATQRFIHYVGGWEGLIAGGLEIREVPGDHRTLIYEPHVPLLAQALRECLDRAHCSSGEPAAHSSIDPCRNR